MRNLKVCYLVLVSFYVYFKVNAAYFERCDLIYRLQPGVSYLKSYGFPNSYPLHSSCRYKFVAPRNHNIKINCSIDMPKDPDNRCTIALFQVARDGDLYLRDADTRCGYGTFQTESMFRSLVVAYISNGFPGSFQCQLTVQPQDCDCGWSVNTKIVHGENAGVNEFPSMVALKDTLRNRLPYCGASIISHKHLLTAAHCARVQTNPSYIEAHIGRHDLHSSGDTKYFTIYYIASIIQHENYNPKTVKNDIAILVTTKDIEFSRGVGPICLPPLSNENNLFSYETADIVGWGTTKFSGPLSPTLLKATVTITDNDSCSRLVGSDDIVYSEQICTTDYTDNKKDSCQHDSGGPVIFRQHRQFLVGIISYGMPCGVGEHPTAVNTRVTSYLRWIYTKTERITCNIRMF